MRELPSAAVTLSATQSAGVSTACGRRPMAFFLNSDLLVIKTSHGAVRSKSGNRNCDFFSSQRLRFGSIGLESLALSYRKAYASHNEPSMTNWRERWQSWPTGWREGRRSQSPEKRGLRLFNGQSELANYTSRKSRQQCDCKRFFRCIAESRT